LPEASEAMYRHEPLLVQGVRGKVRDGSKTDMNLRKQQQPVIILVVVVVLLFVFLVRISLNLQNSKTNFRNEMAQRLDLEEALDNMEKERRQMILELRSLRERLAAATNEIKRLSEDLETKKKEVVSANASLEDLRREKKSPSSVSM
jgi:predicted RND superfamily exporter protein